MAQCKKCFAVAVGIAVLCLAGLSASHLASRSSAADAVAMNAAPRVGALAPDFALNDSNGKEWRLSSLRGRKVVVNFLCGCPNCTRLAATLEKIHREQHDIHVLGIMSKHPDAIRSWVRATGVTFPMLFDPFGRVEQQYESNHCPRSFVIDRVGSVVGMSADGASSTMIARTVTDALGQATH